MFALDVQSDARRALALARVNVQLQREPIDLLLLARAAAAARDDGARREVKALAAADGTARCAHRCHSLIGPIARGCAWRGRLAAALRWPPAAARAAQPTRPAMPTCSFSRSGDTLALRWDIALRDLDAALDLDGNGDRKLSWGEVRARIDDIQAYALARLRLQQGRCALAQAQPPAVEDRVDGAYLVLQLRAAASPAPRLELDYRLFREVDPTHRGLLRVEADGGAAPIARSLDPAGGPVQLVWPGAETSPSGAGFFRDGVHHILIGYDHVLFLICLLLPAVLRRRPRRLGAGGDWREAVWPMVGMVTMFTVAHSITLALAASVW